MKFDPWDDAQEIAKRLSKPNARLVVVIGALAWCEKCRLLHSEFEAQVAAAPNHETYLWLDLEEHAAYLGQWVPPDMPLALFYEEGNLTAARRWSMERGPSAGPLLKSEGVDLSALPVPDIWAALCRKDWAIS